MGRLCRWLPVTLVTILILSACMSTDPTSPPGVGLGWVRGRPGWIDSYPADSAYYIGVGSSKTGDQGADMMTARLAALVNLASSISTQIRSELLISAREDSEGNAFQAAEQTIRESVDQNIREVEVADSYYSSADGYWFYLRLSKDAWAAIQSEETDRLSRRIISLIEPDLTDDDVSIATRLGTLWKGWRLLADSPYAGLLETSLLGEEGVLIDLIERRIVGYIDSLSIRFDPVVLRTAPGRPVALHVEVRTNLPLRPGMMDLILADQDTDVFEEVVTDDGGSYSGELAFEGLEPGSRRLTGTIDFDRIGLDLMRISRRMFLPERDMLLEISLIEASLAVAATEGAEVINLSGSIESLLSSKMPVKFRSGPAADYDVRVFVQFRSAPPNDYDIIVVFTKANITVSRDGATLASYETPEFKDGGLSLSQAQTRSFEKFITGLEETTDLEQALERAFSFQVE